jgi:hypothetical protein
MNNILTESNLRHLVPSIYAEAKAESRSDRYTFVPTWEIVKSLQKINYYPVKAMQCKARTKEKKEVTKHMIRFRQNGIIEKNGLLPEIVLMNSHDGSSSYQLRAGIYRLVCSNGLVVGNDQFCYRVRHQGDIIGNVLESVNQLTDMLPGVTEKAIDWSQKFLTREQQEVFAESASKLKWDRDETLINPNEILRVRRAADYGKDLWTTFNVIQENFIRGGVLTQNKEGVQSKSRKTNSINENLRLNTALWTLTEKMAELI